MNPALGVVATVTTVLAAICGIAVIVCIVRNRLPGLPTLGGLLALEVATLVAVVINAAQLGGTDRAVETATLIGYLVFLPLLVPAGVVWAFIDRTRFGIANIVLACVAVAAMVLRTQQIWEIAYAG